MEDQAEDVQEAPEGQPNGPWVLGEAQTFVRNALVSNKLSRRKKRTLVYNVIGYMEERIVRLEAAIEEMELDLDDAQRELAEGESREATPLIIGLGGESLV